MRKWQQEQLLNIIENMKKVHTAILAVIKSGNLTAALNLLADCQESAVALGNAIETMENTECATISRLEEYCETLYTVSQKMQEETAEDSLGQLLDGGLAKVKESVETDIVIRKEIVFFPYKAAMWDSLESIYLAAKADNECDAYCVPIPYFDKNPDGTFGQMHYEGNEYPANIEVMDWESYDFENRRPDAVYIHNPYDSWNYVTSVHTRYYSSNLKKYTDELVYIPYFVAREIEPEDQQTIGQMKHFIWTPGVIYADKVIVQSEKMKQIYVNEYLKAAQANGLQGQHVDRQYLEQKILGLGSPKFDKVLNTKREDLEIPAEWRNIIQKPDGSRKKIIFYNTTIAALLANDDKMLDKIEDVLNVFKENQADVALLWRPHPLIAGTIQSMRPQLWERYKKIVDSYKEENWGIYDATADMDRAIALSDAYYGDGSSVVELYQETGKPIMLQNPDVSYCK